MLEAANRCARALGSSLVLEDAFDAFIREVRALVPFDRIAVVLVEGERLQVLAAAGSGVDDVFPPGTARPIAGSIFDAVAAGRTVYRRDLSEPQHPEEEELLALGLRSRLAAPLLVGSVAVGLISFSRHDADAALSGTGRGRSGGMPLVRAFKAINSPARARIGPHSRLKRPSPPVQRRGWQVHGRRP